MNHNNFYFTQIPGKTYDMFLAILVRFFPMEIFSQKNPALSHTTIYGPLTSCKVSEKWTEGKMDGQTLFYWTLLAEAVVGGLTTSLQEVTGGNTQNIVLKRMLTYFLKIPPLKKILQF